MDGRDDLCEKCGESETRLRRQVGTQASTQSERFLRLNLKPKPPNILFSIFNFYRHFAFILLLDSQNYVIPHMCTVPSCAIEANYSWVLTFLAANVPRQKFNFFPFYQSWAFRLLVLTIKAAKLSLQNAKLFLCRSSNEGALRFMTMLRINGRRETWKIFNIKHSRSTKRAGISDGIFFCVLLKRLRVAKIAPELRTWRRQEELFVLATSSDALNVLKNEKQKAKEKRKLFNFLQFMFEQNNHIFKWHLKLLAGVLAQRKRILEIYIFL